MDFLQKMVFPVRRVWFAVSSPLLRPRKNGRGGLILKKLHDDVETCGYEDVKVMWEMLRKSESELINTTNHHHPHDHHQQAKWKPWPSFWRQLHHNNHNTTVNIWSNSIN